MFARALIAAAVSASAVAAYSIPACWETCFQKYDVDNENCLCSAPLEKVITACISGGCPANNSTSSAGAYQWWLSSYCGENTGTTTTYAVTTEYTTVCPVTATDYTGSPTVYTTSSAVPTVYSTTAVVTPSSYTPVTSAVQTSSLSSGTWIPTSYATTYTPGLNTWTGSNSWPAPAPYTSPVAATTPAVWTSPVAATTPVSATTTGGAWPSATIPAYNGAAGVKVGGMLGAVGAIVVAML